MWLKSLDGNNGGNAIGGESIKLLTKPSWWVGLSEDNWSRSDLLIKFVPQGGYGTEKGSLSQLRYHSSLRQRLINGTQIWKSTQPIQWRKANICSRSQKRDSHCAISVIHIQNINTMCQVCHLGTGQLWFLLFRPKTIPNPLKLCIFH